MADQEVIKHTKKIYKIWNSEEHSVWHKLKEFGIEIFIIVFAVSLSIWLHGKSEHNHQQQDVKEFLIGLKGDLKNDMEEMEADKATYIKVQRAFAYITSVKWKEPLNKDSLRLHSNYFFNGTGLVANNGRFEGFKSSGKIGLIENRELQNYIMDLYQEDIPVLITFTDAYSFVKKRFIEFHDKNLRRVTDSTTNLGLILKTDEAQNIAANLTDVSAIISQYDKCISDISKIIAEIDKEYQK